MWLVGEKRGFHCHWTKRCLWFIMGLLMERTRHSLLLLRSRKYGQVHVSSFFLCWCISNYISDGGDDYNLVVGASGVGSRRIVRFTRARGVFRRTSVGSIQAVRCTRAQGCLWRLLLVVFKLWGVPGPRSV